MITSRARARDRRSFRLECLEDRHLLSVSAARHPAIVIPLQPTLPPTQPGIPQVIQGKLQGTQASNGELWGTPIGFLSFSGHGSARPVGYVYFGTKLVKTANVTTGTATPTFTVSKGTAVLTMYNGDQISIAYNGSGQAPKGKAGKVQLVGTVTGGTGRFNGVSGSFFATGSIKGNGNMALSFTTALTYPAIP